MRGKNKNKLKLPYVTAYKHFFYCFLTQVHIFHWKQKSIVLIIYKVFFPNTVLIKLFYYMNLWVPTFCLYKFYAD